MVDRHMVGRQDAVFGLRVPDPLEAADSGARLSDNYDQIAAII